MARYEIRPLGVWDRPITKDRAREMRPDLTLLSELAP